MKSSGVTQYFAEKEEQAVIDYINSTSIDEKNKIYNEILIEPFRKMVQSILRRYPIHIGRYEMEEVEANALSHLIEHMVKFNPEKITKLGNRTKAFSYCQTIIRNYYKDHSKRTNNEEKINLYFDNYADEIENDNENQYEIDFDVHYKLDNLISDVINEINSELLNNKLLKKNEVLIGDAIINILKNWETLFIEETPDGNYNKRVTNKFAKNKILFFLKEQTGLTTKEIRIAIRPFKDIYFFNKNHHFDL